MGRPHFPRAFATEETNTPPSPPPTKYASKEYPPRQNITAQTRVLTQATRASSTRLSILSQEFFTMGNGGPEETRYSSTDDSAA